jgi:cytochrome c553
MAIRTFLVGLILLGVAASLQADEKEGLQFFEKHIRPVLVTKCYKCHSTQSKEPKGGLLLDTRDGIRRGGDNGKAVVPNNLDDSLILEAIRYEGLEMPPKEQLPKDVIAKFEQWVKMGAPDPRDGKSAPIRRKIDFEKSREFWAFQPIKNPDVPKPKTNKGWSKNSIDDFVLTRLNNKGLKPVRDVEPHVLCRRIYFDLIGLPPTPEQVAEFVKAYQNDNDKAVNGLLGQLLDSPRFGERWARHWLDTVRYAESTGMERNYTYPHAWRFRDYVIDSFNSNKPFDQFIKEQIAGDQLKHSSPADRKQKIVATGFLALGPKSLNGNNKEKFAMDVVDEQIDVTTRAFIGLTASCARCHDHKFDPIPQTEYYALAGIFRSTETFYGTSGGGGNRNAARLLGVSANGVSPVQAKGTAKQKKKTPVAAIEKRLVTQKKQLSKLENQIKNDPKRAKALKKTLTRTRIQIKKFEAQLAAAKPKAKPEPKPTNGAKAVTELVMGVLDRNAPADTKLRVRGEPNDMGDTIPRGFLTIASVGHVPEIDAKASGRMTLANWIVQEDNPLTARVAVNRFWQHLFGRGIVGTINNFGASGDRPTHPELLDWLASDFRSNGWSVKDAIRQIMSSRTYRLASINDEQAAKADPGNELLWRANHRRLEVEAMRDAMLFASGQIDLKPEQGSIVATVGNGNIGRTLQAGQFDKQTNKRSVYLPILRGALPEILKIFDFPEPSIISGSRDVTTVATQALFMMNSDFVIEQSDFLATRILAEDMDDATRVKQTYEITLSRQPTDDEVEMALRFVSETTTSLGASEDNKKSVQLTKQAWSALVQAMFASAEFRYIE